MELPSDALQEEFVDPKWRHLPDRIADTLRDQTILLTGSTGLIGKVLLEKLLRCCGDVRTIYVLLRPKKGRSVAERLDAVFESPLFDLLKAKRADFRSKVRPIRGDVVAENLGISQEDRKLLAEEVNVVYHCAGNVRFDEPLKPAMLVNVRGCKSLLELAREMKDLKILVHVSTAYAHTDESTLEERMYDPQMDPHDVLKVVEILKEETLEDIAADFLRTQPNSYSFSKALSEGLLNEEMRKGELPVVLVRPSVVVPIYRSPIPGWTDSLNGPSGLLLAAAKGVARTFYMTETSCSDMVPVDIVASAICTTTYAYLTTTKEEIDLSVVNICTGSGAKWTWECALQIGRKIATTSIPMNWVLWYPGGSPSSSYYYHMFSFYLKQMLPAMVLDALLIGFGRRPLLVKIQKRIKKGYDVFEYYTQRHWHLVNEKQARIARELLNEKEAAIYQTHIDDMDLEEFLRSCAIAARRYIMKEPDHTLPTARRHLKMMYAVDKLLQVLLLYMIYCLIYWFIA